MRKFLNIVWMFIVMVLLASCDLSYTPPMLPVEIIYNPVTREVTIQGEIGMATPIGTFKMLTYFPDDDLSGQDLLVIIRDRNFGTDDVYVIHKNSGEQIEIVASGKTKISLSDDVAVIDVTETETVKISFQIIKDDSVHWANAPFGYRPWSFSKYVWVKANSTFQSRFVWICPGFIIGAILYALSLAAILFDLLAMLFFGIGLLLRPVHLQNIYYIVLVVVPLGLFFKKYFT